MKNAILIGALPVIVAAQIVIWGGVEIILPLFLAAYLQSITLSLTSRARNRSSSMYHLIASFSAGLVWFITFKQLIVGQMSLFLFTSYTAATVLGSLTGAQVSVKIEKIIGAVADEESGSQKSAPAAKKASVTLPLIVLAALSAAQFVLVDVRVDAVLVVLLASAFFRDMSYASRTWAQNRDSKALIVTVNIGTAVTEFFTWGGLFATGMPWTIFLPYTLCSTGGSLFGAYITSIAGKKVGASADAHVKKGGEEINFGYMPYVLITALIATDASFINPHGVSVISLVVVSSFLKSIAFTMVSRARNRNNLIYHFLASIGSNGIWFLMLHYLTVNNLDPSLFATYAMASAAGGLISVQAAMWIEKKIGALADAHVK